ncbi:MAG: FAD-dependent oxidoreductase, partial [Myxococcota bacterium]
TSTLDFFARLTTFLRMSRTPRDRLAARVIATKTLSPSVIHLTLSLREPGLDYKPGQWVNFYLPDVESGLWRSYSVASYSDGREIELAVTQVQEGKLSPRIHGLKAGDDVEVDGPWGVFTLDAAPLDAPLLFVATGTGLTPIRSMLHSELASDRKRSVCLLFGCRHEEDQLWWTELSELEDMHPRFTYISTLSKPRAGSTQRQGYVQTHVASVLKTLPQDPTPHAFICGLSRMIEEVRSVLKEELSWDRTRIHTEKYD